MQSGGRGMENAKHSAQIRQIQVKDDQQENRLDGHDTRLDTVEGDIERIADHAWKEISQCGVGSGSGGTGYKITWNPAGSGTWGCIQETDPTVKTFAKTDLPNCGAGQVLRADGNSFSCTTSAGTSGFEVDPYVQDFARNTVYTINACASDEVLTMTNKRLRCIKSQDLNITETDPTVQPFAKATLPECAAGQVLTTGVGGGGVAVLRCVTDTDGGYAELDPSVGTITNSKWCIASGGKIHCNQNPPVLTEADPTVKAFAKANLPTCVAGKVLTGNGTALSCADAGASAGGSNTHVQYNSNGSLAGNSGLTYNGAGALTVSGSAPIAIRTTSGSTSGYAIYAQASAASGSTYGGYFDANNSPAGAGVVGIGGSYGARFVASASTGATFGVFGQSNSPSGYGVYGTGAGYGIYSQGNAHVQGNLTISGSTTAASYYQSSDRNLKENIVSVTNPFALLNAIEGKHYTWKESKKPAYGVIAQDVEKVMPEAVQTADDGRKSVEYSQLIAPMLEAIKQLESRVQELEGKKKASPLAEACPPDTFCLMNIGAQ